MRRAIETKTGSSNRRRKFFGYVFVLLALCCFQAVLTLAMRESDLLAALGWIKTMACSLAAAALLFFIGAVLWKRGLANIHGVARLEALDPVPPSAADPRPPVLYLRSFQDDGSAPKQINWGNLLGSAMYWTDEQRLVEGLKALGPVTAIGKPGESLPQAGAARTYCNECEWQEEVMKRMQTAQVVVFRCAATEGLLWELQTALKQVSPERLLFWLMFSGNREEQWNRFCSTVQQWLPVKLPAKIGNALFLSFERNWNPQVFGSVGKIQGPLAPKIFLPFLRRLHPNASVNMKREPLLMGIQALAVLQVIAVWVGVGVTLAGSGHSSKGLIFRAILCGTGAILGAIGLWEKVWAAVVLGFLISPTVFLAMGAQQPRDDDPKDPIYWILFLGAFAALLLLIWLALSLERRRDRRPQIVL
jgi:hypothetical protein